MLEPNPYESPKAQRESRPANVPDRFLSTNPGWILFIDAVGAILMAARGGMRLVPDNMVMDSFWQSVVFASELTAIVAFALLLFRLKWGAAVGIVAALIAVFPSLVVPVSVFIAAIADPNAFSAIDLFRVTLINLGRIAWCVVYVVALRHAARWIRLRRLVEAALASDTN